MCKEYKVLRIIGMNPKKLEDALNKEAVNGWTLFWTDGVLAICQRSKDPEFGRKAK